MVGLLVVALAMTGPSASFSEVEAPLTPELARVRIDLPECMVWVDGVELGESPIDVKLRPGRHSFTFRSAGFLPETVEVTVAGGERSRVQPHLRPTLLTRLSALGLGLGVGYAQARVSPVGNAAGIGARQTDGVMLALTVQVMNVLELQVDAGGLGPMTDGAPPPTPPGETAHATHISSSFIAFSAGLTTPVLPVFHGRWIGVPGSLMLSGAARLGVEAANTRRSRSDCSDCAGDSSLDVGVGTFRELSVGAAWGFVSWPSYGGIGVRVAQRTFLRDTSAFSGGFQVLLEARVNLSGWIWDR